MATPSSSHRAGLLDLPDELLLCVLNYLDCFTYPSRSASLYGINLANRRLHGLSSPYLYSKISFYAGVPYLVLRTICNNQDLAYHVKAIEWDYDTSEPESFRYKPGVLAVKQHFDLDGTHDQITQLAVQGNETAKTTLEKLKCGRFYLGDLRALHILLMFAPNVEHLGVVETYRWDDYAYWFTPLAYGDAVSRLTSVKINGPMRLQNITILLMLPTMRLLELTQVTDMRQEYGRTFEWESQDIWENDLNESKSNIEHFHLYDSYVKVSDLKVALRAMRGLKSFVYEHTPNELSIGFLNLDTAAVAELIRSQPHTLDSLHILRKQDVPCIAIQPHILYQTVRALPNLVDLELSHMSWPSSNFKTPEWQDLPAELVCLTLDSINAHCYDGNHDFAHLERNLEALAIRKRRGEFPNLRTLTLARWHPWYGCVPTNVTYIKTMLHDAGIEFITRPAMIGSSSNMSQDIGWVELQTEPEWVIVHKYFIDSG